MENEEILENFVTWARQTISYSMCARAMRLEVPLDLARAAGAVEEAWARADELCDAAVIEAGEDGNRLLWTFARLVIEWAHAHIQAPV